MAIEPMSMEKYSELISQAVQATYRFDQSAMHPAHAERVVDAIIVAAGLVGPVPELDTDKECSALMWDSKGGNWQVCDDDLGHAGDHDNSEWTWRDDDPNSISAEVVRSWA